MGGSGVGEPTRPVSALVAVIADIVGEAVDEALLQRALTHRSFAYEHGGVPNNERLEFLGDSVLGIVITDELFSRFPDLPEGQLAKLRAAVVNSRALAKVGRGIDLGEYLYLGRGEESTGGRDKSSIVADTVEAVIGAVYRSCGIATASVFVHHLFDPVISASARMGAGLDWKTSLQEICSELSLMAPAYRMEETGPDHEKVFTATAVVGEEHLGAGSGRSKKEAEQRAAEQAWEVLDGRRMVLGTGERTHLDVSATPDAD